MKTVLRRVAKTCCSRMPNFVLYDPFGNACCSIYDLLPLAREILLSVGMKSPLRKRQLSQETRFVLTTSFPARGFLFTGTQNTVWALDSFRFQTEKLSGLSASMKILCFARQYGSFLPLSVPACPFQPKGRTRSRLRAPAASRVAAAPLPPPAGPARRALRALQYVSEGSCTRPEHLFLPVIRRDVIVLSNGDFANGLHDGWIALGRYTQGGLAPNPEPSRGRTEAFRWRGNRSARGPGCWPVYSGSFSHEPVPPSVAQPRTGASLRFLRQFPGAECSGSAPIRLRFGAKTILDFNYAGRHKIRTPFDHRFEPSSAGGAVCHHDQSVRRCASRVPCC